MKSSIPSRQLSYGSIYNSMQAIPSEINLRQEKWLVISIYCLPSQDSGFFIHSLTEIIDQVATNHDNHLSMGNFSMEANNRMFKRFLDSNRNNRKYSFKYT